MSQGEDPRYGPAERDHFERIIRSLGGEGILKPEDIPSLESGRGRVLFLMHDGGWYRHDAICMAAGEYGKPATEGLRRMRELRASFHVERRRLDEKRQWEYRLIRRKKGEPDRPEKPSGPTQIEFPF